MLTAAEGDEEDAVPGADSREMVSPGQNSTDEEKLLQGGATNNEQRQAEFSLKNRSVSWRGYFHFWLFKYSRKKRAYALSSMSDEILTKYTRYCMIFNTGLR